MLALATSGWAERISFAGSSDPCQIASRRNRATGSFVVSFIVYFNLLRGSEHGHFTQSRVECKAGNSVLYGIEYSGVAEVLCRRPGIRNDETMGARGED